MTGCQRVLSVAICGMMAVVSHACSSPPASPPPATPLSDAARAQLAPHGRLRVALNHSNFLLVSSPAPDAAGVAPTLGRELARRANAVVEFVGYANAGLAADAAAADAWDVAFIGAEPARARDIRFSPAYVEIEATYLVPAASPLRTTDEVDRAGVRIATTARAAYTLYLQRTLQHATLVEAETIPATFELFTASQLDALAGLKPRLLEDVKKVPGARLLEGRFTAVQQAIAVRHDRAAAADYLAAFVTEIIASGWLRTIIEQHGANGLTVAAPPDPRRKPID